jgi:hypothetical protein
MSADRLVPQTFEDVDEEFLAPDEIIRRLRAEFPVVEIDKDAAIEMIQERLDYAERKIARGDDPYPETEEKLARLRSGINDAYLVSLADDPKTKTKYLQTVVMPCEPLFFGYTSDKHQQASKPLLKRCAKALDYYIENF